MPGPCPAHAHLSEPGCPACRPGHAWLDWLAEQQARIRQWDIADRVVYLGVRVTGRSGLARMLGRAWDRAADLEITGLSAAVSEIGAVAGGPGLGAVPATPGQLQWLMARSCGLHLPAPAAMEENPAPAPYALPATAPAFTGSADLAELASAFRWSARPFGRTVLITRADGAAVHVAVLTVAGMTDQDDAGPSPGVQRTDRLEFPAEWVITADVRRREDVAREMRHLIDRIRHQAHHITAEHSQPAPLSLDRQMQAARRIEDESQTGPEAFASRVHAWMRIAVAGETEQQAVERARRVAELYAPGITVMHTPGQYALAREFIPGEPLADFGHRRSIETAALAAGMPNASASAGHRHGFPIGVTTSTAVRAVTLDPSGLLDRLCHLSEIARTCLAVNLLESAPGTLNPYQLIPDPPPVSASRAHAAGAAREKRARDLAAASVARRALVADILFFPAGDAAWGPGGRGVLLSVMTLRGLVLPGEARLPEERTTEEQLSIPVLHLAAQLVRRMLLDLPRAARKLAVLDEAHALTRDPAGRSQVLELARDSRKNNVCAIVVSQNPGDLLAAGIANLVGAAFAFRTEGEAERAATLGLLGLPRGAGHEQQLASLSRGALAGPGVTGECLMRDGHGGIEQVQVDLGGNPALRAALDSTPTGQRFPHNAWRVRPSAAAAP